jgi:hypothetical protein
MRARRSRFDLESNDGDAWRVAIEPIVLAAGNPGSRRWFIRDRGLSGGERWRLSRDHYLDSKSTFRIRDLGTFAETGKPWALEVYLVSRASPRRSDGRRCIPVLGRFPPVQREIHPDDQECSNFPPLRDLLFGSGRVALHLWFQRRRHFSSGVGRVKHNG